MTHREQLIAMLDAAGIDYGHTEGDCIIIHECIKFHFDIAGGLKFVIREGELDPYYWKS